MPVTICFNKVDLGEAGLVDKYRAIYERAGYEVHFVSTYQDTGLEEMKNFSEEKPRSWRDLQASENPH